MAGILDAETHIAEPQKMWDGLDPEWYAHSPTVVSVPDDTQYETSDHMWLIDGQIYPRTAVREGNILVTPPSQTRARDRVDCKAHELLDLPIRFEDMKVRGLVARSCTSRCSSPTSPTPSASRGRRQWQQPTSPRQARLRHWPRHRRNPDPACALGASARLRLVVMGAPPYPIAIALALVVEQISC